MAAGKGGTQFHQLYRLGVLASFLAVALIRSLLARKEFEIAAVLLAGSTLGYLIFQRKLFLSMLHLSLFLHIVQFFILGFLLARENRKESSLWPFPILIVASFSFEYIQIVVPGRIFDTNDIWFNLISGLTGLVLGFF